MNHRTVDMTPSWAEAARMIAVALEHASPEGKELARQELFRMGELLDAQLNASCAHSDAKDDWVECDEMGDEERRSYLSPDCPEGYETVVGYLARFNPWAIRCGLADPEATQRDGFWLKHRSSERGIAVVKVKAPAAFAADGIEHVNAYPVSLLQERLGD